MVSSYLVPGGAVTFNFNAKGISALTTPEHGNLMLKTCRITGTSPLADTFTYGCSNAIIPEDGPPGTPILSYFNSIVYGNCKEGILCEILIDHKTIKCNIWIYLLDTDMLEIVN